MTPAVAAVVASWVPDGRRRGDGSLGGTAGRGQPARAASGGRDAATADGIAARMAARGAGAVRPLHGEHLHRQGVGRRHREPAHLRSRPARRPAVGPRGEARRLPQPDPHGQAPRRLLPLADADDGPQRAQQPLARRIGRPGPRVHRRVPRRRPRRGPLSLAVGPQRAQLRPGPGLRRLLSHAARRAARPVRSAGRSVVRRRQRRRAQRQAPGVRLAADPRRRAAAAAQGGDVQRQRARRALDRQRGRRGRHDLLEHRRSRARAASRVRRAVGAVAR